MNKQGLAGPRGIKNQKVCGTSRVTGLQSQETEPHLVQIDEEELHNPETDKKDPAKSIKQECEEV